MVEIDATAPVRDVDGKWHGGRYGAPALLRNVLTYMDWTSVPVAVMRRVIESAFNPPMLVDSLIPQTSLLMDDIRTHLEEWDPIGATRYLFDAAPHDAGRCPARVWTFKSRKKNSRPPLVPVFRQCEATRAEFKGGFCPEHSKAIYGSWDPEQGHRSLLEKAKKDGWTEARLRCAHALAEETRTTNSAMLDYAMLCCINLCYAMPHSALKAIVFYIMPCLTLL